MYLGLSRIKVTIWLVIVTMVTSAMLYKGYSAFGTLGESWLPLVLKIYGFFIALWAAYMLLAFRFYRKSARCINRERGTVEVVGHSKIRVGKEWLIDILVSYNNQQQEIKYLEPGFQFRYPQGSRIPLKFMPGSFVQCRIDRADKNAVSLVFHDVTEI